MLGRCDDIPSRLTLQTLTEIGAEQNSTVVFPMPIDIIKPFLEIMDQAAKPVATNGSGRAKPGKDPSLAT